MINSQQTKTHQQEATKATIKIVRFFKNYIATVLLSVVFYLHFFLPNPEPEVARINTLKYEAQESYINTHQEINDVANALYQNSITKTDFDYRMKILSNQLDSQKTILDSTKEEAILIKSALKRKYFGYPSRHKLLWALGIGVIITLLSYRMLIRSHEIKESNKRTADAIMSFMGLSIGLYFFAWVFYPANDLPKTTYLMLIVAIGISGAVLGYFLTKSNYDSVLVLKEKLKYAMNTITLKIRNNGHIKDDDKYVKDIVSPAVDKYDE